MSRSTIRVLVTAALACGLLAGPATAAKPLAAKATTHVQRAQSGTLSASYSYRYIEKTSRYRSEQLTIMSGGQVVYQEPVDAPQCGDTCAPGGIGSSNDSVAFATFTPGGPPALVLSLYSNYLHCCSVVQVFTPNSSGIWTPANYNFGDPGFTIRDLARNGVDELVSADDRFAYAFTDFAASGFPILVVTYANGQFQNTTRSYPYLIDQDASFWLRLFKGQKKQGYDDTNGVIAAWAADEDELGRSSAVASFLARQALAGHLNTALGNVEPQGLKFVRALQRFLSKTGYLTT